MSGTPVAILGHEENVRMTEQKDRTISVIGTAAPALELWAFMWEKKLHVLRPLWMDFSQQANTILRQTQ